MGASPSLRPSRACGRRCRTRIGITTPHFVAGDRAVSEWTFSGTDASGMRTEAEGADLFTIRNGKLAVKQALRKARPPFKA